VKSKTKENYVALKAISKQQVVDQQVEKYIQQERRILNSIHYPFTMEFFKSYKDNNFVYFLTEYIQGCELYSVVHDMGLLQTYPAQFYTSQILLALEYLHTNGIVHRDIKPENVMIDHGGYIKVVDMGVGKIFADPNPSTARTFTVIGSPYYMAPELIFGKGYSYYIDLWSLGVMLFEFLTGTVPFGQGAADPYQVYEAAATKVVSFPPELKDIEAMRLIDQLLSKVPERRLGTSYSALKDHAWFRNWDWDKLMERQLLPPYVPPKEKTMPEQEIKMMDQQGKKVVEEIEKDLMSGKIKRYNVMAARDPGWDAEF